MFFGSDEDEEEEIAAQLNDEQEILKRTQDFEAISAKFISSNSAHSSTTDSSTSNNETLTSATSAKPNAQPSCVSSNLTLSRTTNEVKLVNGSYLTRILSDSGQHECFLVLFYVPWCPFSARLAPIYNAIPKAFLSLDVLAFDVSKSIGYNTKFGTSAVPIVLLFQHKNVIAKFNYTDKNLTDFIEFVSVKSGKSLL